MVQAHASTRLSIYVQAILGRALGIQAANKVINLKMIKEYRLSATESFRSWDADDVYEGADIK
jgi:hypothetical protein